MKTVIAEFGVLDCQKDVDEQCYILNGNYSNFKNFPWRQRAEMYYCNTWFSIEQKTIPYKHYTEQMQI